MIIEAVEGEFVWLVGAYFCKISHFLFNKISIQMNINSTPKRILAMIGIGIVLVLIFYAIGVPYNAIGSLTGGILFFVWMWLGGKWW